MTMLRPTNLAQRLTKMNLVSVGVAFLLILVVVTVREIINFRNFVLSSVAMQATIIGSNSTAALSFADQKTGAELLSSLKSIPDVVEAVITTKDDAVFARYAKGAAASVPFAPIGGYGHRYKGRFFTLSQPIVLSGETIGSVTITYDIGAFYRNIGFHISLLIVIAIVSIGIANLLFSRLQRSITEPISRLVEAMDAIATTKDYSLRVPLQGEREMVTLSAGFNDMLTQIQVRDSDVEKELAERKQAEERLQESEEHYRLLTETSPNAVTVVDLLGRVLMVNRRTLDLYGYDDVSEVAGRSILEWVPPDERERVGTMFAEVCSGIDVNDFEICLLKRTGRVFWASANASLCRGYGGQPRFVIIVTSDITERKRFEDRLQESERFIRNILDTVDEEFIVVDRDYRIVTANKAFCLRHGGASDNVIGRFCYELSHHTDRPCHEGGEECAVEQVFASGSPRTALHRHADADGRILYVETKAYPVKDQSGEITSVIETITNITEKHLLEEERLKSQKLEAIGTLAGGIAHDFNNLLQGIFGYIAMAKISIERKDRSLTMLEQAEQALHMSVNLTSQLLTFSKGGRPVKKRINLLPVIENAARFALSGSRSDYSLASAPDVWPALADEGQVGQVIQNIVLNADQAMPVGGIVSIGARNVSLSDTGAHHDLEPGDYIEITIRDQGVGIPEQYLDKIFDPYFTTKEKGSGLGLATSYSIIRNHGGRIDVTSDVGKGTTFMIYLPAAETEDELQESPVDNPVARTARILVMDDEELVRNVAGALLETLGHDVDAAENGGAAIEKFRDAQEACRPFDMVILDLTVRGGMGGRDALAALRALDPAVKAIVSSGYSDDDVMANYRRYGFDARISKPYKLEMLRDAVNSLLAD